MPGIKNMLKKIRKKVPVYIPVFQSDLLKGRTALITGGSSGLGYAIAEAFLNAGSTVVLCGRNEKKLINAKERLSKSLGGLQERIYYYILDVSLVDQTASLIPDIMYAHNVDILVNNAGISNSKSFKTMSENEYDSVMNTNLKGIYFLCQSAAKYMVNNGVRGNILNIGSSSSLRPATLPYTLSKWGIRGLTEGLAKSLISYGIVVNAIAPGQSLTSMITGDEDLNAGRSPIERLITPAEVGNMSVILCSALGRAVVGDTVYLTGGAGILTLDDIDYTY